jgi:hypothetical protein
MLSIRVVTSTNEPFRYGDTSFERRNDGRADCGLLLFSPGGRGDKLSKKQKTKCEPFITRKKSIQANEITSIIAVMQRLWQIATPTVTVPLEGADSTST